MSVDVRILINSIDSFFEQDIRLISNTRMLIDNLRNNITHLQNEIYHFNNRYNQAKRLHQNTLQDHENTLTPIKNEIQTIRNNISNIKSRIISSQNLLDDERSGSDNCIREILRIQEDEIQTIIRTINQNILGNLDLIRDSVENDENFLIQYRCINRRLEEIIRLNDEQPQLPELINLSELKNNLNNEKNNFKQKEGKLFSENIDCLKNRLKRYYINQEDILQKLYEIMKICISKNNKHVNQNLHNFLERIK